MRNGELSPSLVFDERFHERSEKDQIEYLKKLCASQNEALDMMQKERNVLQAEVNDMKFRLQSAQTAFEIQKNITRDMVNQSNADDQGVAERIHELEKKVKDLGGKY